MKSKLLLTKIPAILSILLPGLLKSQVHYADFIDSVEMRVDNRVIYASHETFLKFVSKDMAIPLYTDGMYKLVLVPVPVYQYRQIINVYRNDSLLPMEWKEARGDYESCTLTESNSMVYEYCKAREELSSHILVKICYRSTRLLPEDPEHYSLNYREGVWTEHSKFDGEVRVSFHNDEKHGPASVLDKDSMLHEAMFEHNFLKDHGKVNTYRSSFDILESCYSPKTNTYPSFAFVKRHRSKRIETGQLVSVYYDKKGLTHDSVSYKVNGELMELIRDTMIIGVEDLYIHDFYKRYTDSLHAFYVRKPEAFVKIPIKDITKVYRDRDLIQTPMVVTAGLAFAGALLVAPLVSIQKGGFNSERYATVSLTSLGIMSAAITTAIVFGQQKFVLKRGTKNRRTWKIRPEK